MKSLRITFVDDNQDLADALCSIAEFEGHKARAFYSAEELLAVADGFEFDVYWLDIGLPGMTGYELATLLRERSKGRSCLIYTLAGFGDALSAARSASSGCNAHFVKPLGIQTLLVALKEAVDKMHCRSETAPTVMNEKLR